MFCNFTSNHLSITQNDGRIRPCCEYIGDDSWLDCKAENVSTLESVLKSYRWFNLREEHVEGGYKHSGCINCEKQEKINILSHRQWGNHFQESNNLLEDLEISLGNNCNMMCRICRPGQSSMWDSAIEKIPLLNKIDRYSMTKNGQEYVLPLLKKSNLSNLKRVTILGGEPLINPNFNLFIDLLESKCNLKNLELRIVTNGSIFPSSKIKTFNKMKNVYIDLSIDAIGKHAETIRYGQPWKLIYKNIKKWLNNSFNVKIANVISILNVNKIDEVVNFALDLNLPVCSVELEWPKYLRSSMIPKNMRKKWVLDIEEKEYQINFFHAMYNHKEISRINSIINVDEIDPENYFIDFINATKMIDNYQNIKFKDSNSEIWEIVNDYRH